MKFKFHSKFKIKNSKFSPKSFSKFLLILILITSWIFSGFPQIWQNPPIPPKIQEAFAVKLIYSTYATSTWTVPANVTKITVKAWGAGGAGGGTGVASGGVGGAGGGGGFIQGTATTTPGESLTIVVGNGGTDGTDDTTNGGGGGGGGGYSAVRRGITNDLTDFLFIAGGGGGGGGEDDGGLDGGAGGAGGGTTGVSGSSNTAGAGGGGGGTQTGGGTAGTADTAPVGITGSAGAWLSGGAGSAGGSTGAGGAGGANGGAIGGSGTTQGSDTGGGGGGGAGWYGGGGGGATTGTDGTAGGGGGSSFATSTATATSTSSGSGVNAGNNTDADYVASAGVGGASTTAGNVGRVVILYSRTPSFAGGAVPTESSDPVDYGSTVTFSATAGDADNDPWYLAICDSSGATTSGTGAPDCYGTKYCVSSSAVASSTQNTCQWTANTAGSIAWQGYACDATSTPYAATCSSADTTNSPLKVKGTITLADHTAGQLTDQFAGDVSTTTELFRFRLTPNYENASTTLTFDLSLITGIVSGDFTSGSGKIYVDSDSNGRISGTETTEAFGCANPSISDTSGTITCNATTTISAATDYIYKATVNNLVVNDTITFGLATSKIIAIGVSSQTYTSKLTVSGSATNVTHTTDVAASLTLIVDTDNFPALTPGTPRFATSTVSVNTNKSTGWYVTLEREDADTTLDLNTDATVNIIDQAAWTAPAATTTHTGASSVKISSFDNSQRVLAFRVMTASSTNGSMFFSSSWWGSADSYIDNVNTLWAGIPAPSSGQKIGISSVSSGGSPALNTVLYYLDVPSTQKTGAYSGTITYTAVMNPPP